MRVEVRRLHLLRAVLQEGGYLAASAKVNLAHSAVHRQIKLLEHAVGARVLVPAGRGVVATEIGLVLIALAARLDAEIAEAERRISEIKGLHGGIIRIGMGTTTLLYFMRYVLEDFRAAYPSIELQVTTGSAAEVLADVTAGVLDLGVITEPPGDVTTESGLTYRRLYRERFVFVACALSPLARATSVGWPDLAGEQLIALGRRTRVRAAIDRLLEGCGEALHVAMELENEEAIAAVVQLGLGIGVISGRRLPHPGLRALALPGGEVAVNISAVHRAGHLSGRARALLDACVARAAADASIHSKLETGRSPQRE